MNEYERPFSGGAGVYWLYDSAGRLLYIGVGWEPSYRWRSHAKKKDWWPQVDPTRTKLEWFRVYADALAREKAAIESDKPLHNMTYSTTRPHWSHGRKTQGEIAEENGYVPTEKARKNLSEYAQRAWLNDERFVVSRHGQPAVALVSYEFLMRADEALAALESEAG